MSITRKQVADLREGDVIRVTGWYGVTVEGPLSTSMRGALWLGQYTPVRGEHGQPASWCLASPGATLTVTSRANPPLYVNHSRTEAVPGDVVRDADDEDPKRVWSYADPTDPHEPWRATRDDLEQRWFQSDELPRRLRLLVDGETGQVVP